MSELIPHSVPAVSPFDAIRRTHGDGSHYWSARELMPLLGYDKWERMEGVVERAIVAMNNQGQAEEGERHASRLWEPSGNTERVNYRLTRYGAYMVAMNGDPRKVEVAAAQAYFAIRTREAETAPALTGPELLARAVLEAQSMLAAKDERIAELEPRAEVADRLLDADGDLSVGDAAKALTRAGIDTGATRLFKALERLGWIYRGQSDKRWHVYQRVIVAGWMAVIPQSHYHPSTGELVMDAPQPRITAKGLERLMRDLTPTPDLQLVPA